MEFRSSLLQLGDPLLQRSNQSQDGRLGFSSETVFAEGFRNRRLSAHTTDTTSLLYKVFDSVNAYSQAIWPVRESIARQSESSNTMKGYECPKRPYGRRSSAVSRRTPLCLASRNVQAIAYTPIPPS